MLARLSMSLVFLVTKSNDHFRLHKRGCLYDLLRVPSRDPLFPSIYFLRLLILKRREDTLDEILDAQEGQRASP